jgi:ferredoxin
LVSTSVLGNKLGLGSYTNIELLGDDIEQFIDKDFKVLRSVAPNKKKDTISMIARDYLYNKPVVDKIKCSNCGVCKSICPNNAIHDVNDYPEHNYSNCIYCYCCQEMCPDGAIIIKKNIIGKIYNSSKLMMIAISFFLFVYFWIALRVIYKRTNSKI